MDKHFNGNWAPVDIQPTKTLYAILSSKKYISGYLYLKHSHRHYQTTEIRPSSNGAKNQGYALILENAHSEKPDHEMIMLTAESCGMVSMPRTTVPVKEGMWCKYWCEHVGLTVRLWRVPEDVAALAFAGVPNADIIARMELAPYKNIISLIKLVNPNPFVLSVSHVGTEVISMNEALPTLSTEHPPPPIPFDCFLSIKTLRGVELVMAAPSSIQANSWVATIRLAMYELARLSEYFTLSIMKDPPFYRIWQARKLLPFSDKLTNGNKPSKHSGVLQGMFGKSHEWKNYYATVSSMQVPLEVIPTASGGVIPANGAEGSTVEKKKQNKKLFRSSTDHQMVYVGQLLLYDKKTDTRAVKKIVQITESYLVWPSSAAMGDLSDSANVLRVEGLVLAGTDKKDKRNSSLQIDTSMKTSPEKKIRHSDSKESLMSVKSSLQIPTDAKSETFYLRFTDSWDACQWNTAFMANFHTDADLYERDRQLRDGQVGLVDDNSLSTNGTASAQSSRRSSFINRDSLPSFPPSEASSHNNIRSSTLSLVNNNDKSNRTSIASASSGGSQDDSIDVLGPPTPSSSRLSEGSENANSQPNPGSIPNWMRSHPDTNGPQSQWGILYLRASEVCNLSMMGLSLYDTTREFSMTLQDKRSYQRHKDMAKWNISVKRDRAARRAAEWHEAETKAVQLLTWLASQGVPVNLGPDNSANTNPNAGRSSTGTDQPPPHRQPTHHNDFLPHPVFPDTVFIRAPTNDRPYGMTAHDLNPAVTPSKSVKKEDTSGKPDADDALAVRPNVIQPTDTVSNQGLSNANTSTHAPNTSAVELLGSSSSEATTTSISTHKLESAAEDRNSTLATQPTIPRRRSKDGMVIAPERRFGESLPPAAPPRRSNDVLSGRKSQEAIAKAQSVPNIADTIAEEPDREPINASSLAQPQTTPQATEKLPLVESLLPVVEGMDDPMIVGSVPGQLILPPRKDSNGQTTLPPPRKDSIQASIAMNGDEPMPLTNSDVANTQNAIDNFTILPNRQDSPPPPPLQSEALSIPLPESVSTQAMTSTDMAPTTPPPNAINMVPSPQQIHLVAPKVANGVSSGSNTSSSILTSSSSDSSRPDASVHFDNNNSSSSNTGSNTSSPNEPPPSRPRRKSSLISNGSIGRKNSLSRGSAELTPIPNFPTLPKFDSLVSPIVMEGLSLPADSSGEGEMSLNDGTSNEILSPESNDSSSIVSPTYPSMEVFNSFADWNEMFVTVQQNWNKSTGGHEPAPA